MKKVSLTPKKIKISEVLKLLNNIFLYSGYVANTTFFVSDEDSVTGIVNASDKSSLLSGLKYNKAKSEIASIGFLKEVTLALCGVDCIDLTKKQ